MFAHLMSGGSLAILFVKERSMTPEIHWPDFLLIHRRRSSGSTWCSVWLHSTYWLSLELSVAKVVYDCISAMGLLKTILTENVNENNLVTQDSTTETVAANQSAGHFWAPCCAAFMSCQASLLWSAMGWQLSLHLPHFTIALHLLNLCPAKKSCYENTFFSDFQHLFFEGNAWNFSLSSCPNLAAVQGCK